MAELLFIATIVFVAYVVFVVMGEKKDTSEPGKTEEIKPEAQQPEKIDLPPEPVKSAVKPARAKSAATRAASAKVVAAAPEPAAAKPAAARAASVKAAAKPAAAKSATAKAVTPAPEPAAATAGDSLKNPKTGEVAKIPSSYTFAKRWIKDALVEEGLLDKIYKNSELDDTANAKIQNAFQQLKAMAKYQ